MVKTNLNTTKQNNKNGDHISIDRNVFESTEKFMISIEKKILNHRNNPK